MPNLANLSVDPAALIALGFLVAVLVMTFVLFGWVAKQGAKRQKPPSA